MRALFDTNILIDHLSGVAAARAELARVDAPAISLITWMEVLVGARSDAEAAAIRSFAARFDVVPIDAPIAEKAVELRRTWRLKLPDAIIWASAHHLGCALVTRNVRDFPEGHPAIRVPYRR